MLRSAPRLAAWCAADPGSILLYGNMGPGSAAQREERCAASGTRGCARPISMPLGAAAGVLVSMRGIKELESGTEMLTGDFHARGLVIPGRCEASNPESRDSGSGPSDLPGMTGLDGRSRKWLAALATGLLALAAAQPSLAADEPDAPKGAAVTVLRAKKSCFSSIVEASGIILPREETAVRPDRPGLKVTAILAEPGDTVTSGQPLAKLTLT